MYRGINRLWGQLARFGAWRLFGRKKGAGIADGGVLFCRNLLPHRAGGKEVEPKLFASVCSVSDGGICGGGVSLKRAYKGSFTIEASVIVPTILMMFVVLVYLLFYFHDKNVLTGAAYETAAVGAERKNYDERELQEFFRSRISGKLLLFSNVEEEIQIEKSQITVRCTARKKRMRVTVKMSANRTEPEKFIRDIRKIKVH